MARFNPSATILFGFSRKLLKWVTNYLDGRYQSVIIEGKVSQPLPVTYGVPQGAFHEPLLFVLYIDDIYQVCTRLLDYMQIMLKYFVKCNPSEMP